MKHHSKFLVIFLIFLSCSNSNLSIPETGSLDIIETTTTVVKTTTTTTIAQSISTNQPSKVHIGDLEVGDCYIDQSPNALSSFYREIVFKTSCLEEHNSQIIFKTDFPSGYSDPFVLEAFAGYTCNKARSLYDVIEHVDPKYAELIFRVESIYDSISVKAFEQSKIVCSSYVEHINTSDPKYSINFSFLEDINYYVYDTIWEEEQDSGIVCNSWLYERDSFFAEYMFYFADEFRDVQEMRFVYENANTVIEIDMLEQLNIFSKEGAWSEGIFYYFLPISQIATYDLLYNFSASEEVEKLFSAPREEVFGTFIYTNGNSETFESSCSMGN